MSDRDIRAALERVQAELARTRAQLTQPPDGVDRLAAEARALEPKVANEQAALAEAQSYLDWRKDQRAFQRKPTGGQTLLWLLFEVAAVGAYPLLHLLPATPRPAETVAALVGAMVVLVAWELGEIARHRPRE